MELLEHLGRDIEQRWRAAGRRTGDFPAIAAAALTDHAIPGRLSHRDIVAQALRRPWLPPQSDGSFGQPPLTVFIGPSFFIEVLTWQEATTAIHQHNFCGAFQVLAGSSLHTSYTFDERERIGTRLLLGDTRLLATEHLVPGACREIHSGNGLIHALFHLEHPSATIVVRTMDDATGPQYLYARPHVAYDPFWEPQPHTTRMRLLALLAATHDPALPQALADVVGSADAWSAYRCLQFANLHVPDTVEPLLDIAGRRHGSVVEAMRPSLAEERRQANITLRRARVQEPAHRYLLALLLNLPDRASIFAALRGRYPDVDPVRWVVEQVRQLSGADRIGLEFDAVALQVLEGFMAGGDEPAIEATLRRRYGAGPVQAQQTQLRQLFGQMRDALLLKPLFA